MLGRLAQRSLIACFLLALRILSAGAQQNENASRLNSGQNATNTTAGEAPREKPRSVGSPYVELDSWIYPAIERLAALGYIHTQFLGMRPWTRLECALSVQEAGQEIEKRGAAIPEPSQLHDELQKEFQFEINALAGGKRNQIRLESVYANLTGISGTPLNDSYHFGQTIINN